MMNGFFGMGLGWIIWLVIIVAIVWVIFKFKGDNREPFNKNSESPMDILKNRYAKGEISKEEFERMKKEIGN